MGEFSEFIHGPMFEAGLDSLIKWGGPEAISKYIRSITEISVEKMRKLGFLIVDDKFRSPHLFGAILPKKDGLNMKHFSEILRENKI